jgi:hypothetical protein
MVLTCIDILTDNQPDLTGIVQTVSFYVANYSQIYSFERRWVTVYQPGPSSPSTLAGNVSVKLAYHTWY